MTNGDLRYGVCGACGGGEVYRGEYVAQGGLRPTGATLGKNTVFDAFVCAGCGNAQLHVRLDPKSSSYIRRKLQWIPPQQWPR